MITLEQCYAMLLLNEQETAAELQRSEPRFTVLLGLKSHKLAILEEIVQLYRTAA